MPLDDYCLHIIPVGDLKPHDCSPQCWCRPTETETGMMEHHAMDQRERYETGELKPH